MIAGPRATEHPRRLSSAGAPTIAAMVRPLLRALRPHQWVKNAFVLAPAVFAERLLDLAVLERSLLAFAAFCTAASTTYLINDVRDREADRRHPQKRQRPVASGELPVPWAVTAAVLLGVGALGLSSWLGWGFSAILAGYLGLNLLYSGWLKHVVILDVMVIAVGFVLRIEAGGAAIDVSVSSWLILCTVFIALFLAFSKRRHEILLLQEGAAEQRRVLSHYSPLFLDQMINVVTASSVVAYAIYCVDPATVERFGTTDLVYTVPLVLFGVFRYLYLIYQRPGDKNPTEEILSDGPFLLDLVLWAGAVLWIVYVA
jgi:4-hydroxybenzoate polyprenyltransferase